MTVITRFAPSPTGLLHLGHAYGAGFAFEQAQKAGGHFLVRLEDIDPVRCKPQFKAQILDDLAWLGLSWPQPVRCQSDHLPDYQDALNRLRELGVLYPCRCTRADIMAEIARSGHAPHGPDGVLYPGTCRRNQLDPAASDGAAVAWRLDMARACAMVGRLRWYDREQGWQHAQPLLFGDVVLARKDIPTSYHLSVTLDDAKQGITLVTRGMDLFSATHVHCVLQALLDLPVPEYHHHALLADSQGRRFAKRDHAVTLKSLRDQGCCPDDIWSLVKMSLTAQR